MCACTIKQTILLLLNKPHVSMNRFLNILKFQVNNINELLETYIKNVMVSKKMFQKKKSKVLKTILKILK